MRPLLRRYLSLLLILNLLVTSEAMAVARGAPGPSGLIELCTSSGPVIVAVDDTGAPAGPPHFCPDYVLTLLAYISLTGTAPAIMWGQGLLTGGGTLARVTPVSPVHSRAREPPLVV